MTTPFVKREPSHRLQASASATPGRCVTSPRGVVSRTTTWGAPVWSSCDDIIRLARAVRGESIQGQSSGSPSRVYGLQSLRDRRYRQRTPTRQTGMLLRLLRGAAEAVWPEAALH